MRVALRADASPRMGGGHVMRCLALAEAMLDRGAEVVLVAAELPVTLAARAQALNVGLARIAASAAPAARAGWERDPFSTAAQESDARRTLAAVADFDPKVVIVDHYLLSAPWERMMAPRRVVVIDDLANRPHDCDVLVDQTVGRATREYGALTPARCSRLCGASFALLRPQFAAARAATLDKPRAHPARRALLSFGMTDPAGNTARALAALAATNYTGRIDLALPRDAAGLEDVSALVAKNPRYRVHHDVADMAVLLSSADIAVGAGGSSSWERCALGVPSLTLVLADNQREIAQALERAGASQTACFDTLASQFEALANDRHRLAAMAMAAAAITDGRGADRVAATITNHV